MRAAFGLLSLLVVVAIMLVLFKTYSAPMIKQGQKTHDQAQQMSGRGEDNIPAERSIKLDGEPGSGPLKDLVVVNVTPGGAMEKFYGLKTGDKITAIGQSEIATWNDFGLASAMLVQEGYEKMQPITVIRDGQTMQLPVGKTPGNAAAGGANGAGPGQQQDPNSSPQQRSIESQLKGIKIPGQ